MNARLLPVLVALLGGCVGARYTIPVSAPEAQLVFPGVAAAAQQGGHQAWINDPRRLQVQLTSGTDLYWLIQDNGLVTLDILLPGNVPEDQRGARIAEAKTAADALWSQGLAQRSQYAPPGVVVMPGVVVAQPPPPQGASMAVTLPGMSAAINMPTDQPAAAPPPGNVMVPQSTCQLGSDGVQACGWDCRVGSGGHAVCATTPDGRCVLNSDGTFSCGRNCRLQSNGHHLCQ